MAGADVPANRVEVCDTGHFDVHRCLDDLLHGQPAERGTRKERALAQQGYDAWGRRGEARQARVYELAEHLGEHRHVRGKK